MIAGNLLGQSFWIEGSTFAVKKLLPLGVILLGVRMNFGDVVQVGGLALAMGHETGVPLVLIGRRTPRAAGREAPELRRT